MGLMVLLKNSGSAVEQTALLRGKRQEDHLDHNYSHPCGRVSESRVLSLEDRRETERQEPRGRLEFQNYAEMGSWRSSGLVTLASQGFSVTSHQDLQCPEVRYSVGDEQSPEEGLRLPKPGQTKFTQVHVLIEKKGRTESIYSIAH